jgi:hypothetical protein
VDPIPSAIKAVYPYAPNRQNALPDTPCWINGWSLSDVIAWGDLRVERYSITAQLFVNDADLSRGAAIATAFASEFIRAWNESHGDLDGTTVGTGLRARDPTLGMLEWAGKALPGCQFLLDLDVCVPSLPLFSDPVIDGLRMWTSDQLPGWQQNPLTWFPSDNAPGIYWHYVMLPTVLETEPLTFDVSWMEATLAARVVTPSQSARTAAIRDLSSRLSRAVQDPIQLTDGSWMHVQQIRAFPEVDARAGGQVQFDARFVLDESLADVGGSFGQAVLTWQEQPPPTQAGPTITVTAP